MKTKILFFLFSINIVFSQGFNNDNLKEYLSSIKPYSFKEIGFSQAEFPSSYSLKRYVPEIGNQGQSGSCVGWSVSYYTMSTIYNAMFDTTSAEGKFATSFDPWFLFNQVAQGNYQRSGDTCSVGVHFKDLFMAANRTGNKRVALPPYDLHCSRYWDPYELKEVVSVTSQYRITDWQGITPKHPRAIDFIKYEISQMRHPVPFSIAYYGNALKNLSYGGNNGYFIPTYSQVYDGHAMAIVGYDDYVNGGSFLVVNSWGKQWGVDGYMWMKYTDFNTYADAAFAIRTSFNDLKKNSSDRFVRTSWDYNTKMYEGQKINYSNERWNFHGFGLYQDLNNNRYEIGKFIEGKKEGLFYIIQGTYDGSWNMKKEYFRGGNRYYGFADQKTKNDPLEEYLKTMFKEMEVIWANE